MYEDNGGDRLQRKQLVNRSRSYFGQDLVILSAAGLANVLVFKSKAPKLIKIVNDKDDDSLEAATERVAKQIVKEIKSVEVDKSKYNIRLSDETLAEPVSETLMQLLGQLSLKLDKQNPAYMIGNIITSCLKNFTTTLQIALGVLVRDSKALVMKLH